MTGQILKQISATEAKAKFSELLDAVEHGETIAVTRHGKVIAEIMPQHAAIVRRREESRRAIEELRELRKGVGKVTVEEILAWRHEGHRF